MAESQTQLFDESLTPTRAAIIASRLHDGANVSFDMNDDNEITRVNIHFTESVWSEADFLVKNHDFTISPSAGYKKGLELFKFL